MICVGFFFFFGYEILVLNTDTEMREKQILFSYFFFFNVSLVTIKKPCACPWSCNKHYMILATISQLLTAFGASNISVKPSASTSKKNPQKHQMRVWEEINAAQISESSSSFIQLSMGGRGQNVSMILFL